MKNMKRLLLALLVIVGLQTQAQVSPCDSISYTISSSPNTMVLQLNGVIASGFPAVVSDWSWQVCDDVVCHSDTGQTVYFQQFNTSDTLKVCLIATIDYMGATYACVLQCDSLVFGTNGWMLMNMGPPMIIQESSLNSHRTLVKVLDIFGRESKAVNQLLFYIYNDGTIEKRTIVD